MARYSHRERIEIILAGEKPDRFAGSAWRHFFHMEHDAAQTAEAMVGFQRTFDWDFVKVNPRADYHVEDWGLRQEWSRNEFRKHRKTAFPVNRPEDWERIRPLSPAAPVLAEHLRTVALVRKGVGREVPVLMTVFSPLAIAGRMVPDGALLAAELRANPERIHRALRAITETFRAYAAEIRNAGADGLFFATTQWASRQTISWAEYEAFGIPYDREVLRATEADALNLLHVCGSENYLRELAAADYPCRLYNWDADDPTNLPLDKAYDALPGRTLAGGIDRNGWFLHATPQEVVFQVQKLMRAHDGARVVLALGCAVEPEAPRENYRAFREALG